MAVRDQNEQLRSLYDIVMCKTLCIELIWYLATKYERQQVVPPYKP